MVNGQNGGTPLAIKIMQNDWGQWTSFASAGLGGRTAAQSAAGFSTFAAPYIHAGCYFLQSGVNDALLGNSAASIFASLQSCWSQARAKGAKVVAATVFPTGTNGTINGVISSLNTLIRAASANWDYLTDPAATFTDPTNTLYFLADEVHLNDYGSYLYSAMYPATMGALLKSPLQPVTAGVDESLQGILNFNKSLPGSVCMATGYGYSIGAGFGFIGDVPCLVTQAGSALAYLGTNGNFFTTFACVVINARGAANPAFTSNGDSTTGCYVSGSGVAGLASGGVSVLEISSTLCAVKQKFNLSNVPTSSAGLSTGDVWSNLGILTIV